MDGRAEKSLLMQGVCSLVVAGTCGPSKGQVAHPTKQDMSKMSKLAHAEFMKNGTHTAEQTPWQPAQGGVVDRTALAEPMGGMVAVDYERRDCACTSVKY